MSSEWYKYENLEPIELGQGWHEDTKPSREDMHDWHVDLGGGSIPKARLNIDRSENADIQMDLNTGHIYKTLVDISDYSSFTSKYDVSENETYKYINGILPFPDNSIESVITHHCLEHIGDGFIPLMDDVYRVLKPGGKFRIIVPLFPSRAAYESQDHVRYFGINSFEDFCGDDNGHWHDSFAKPYTKCRFKMLHKSYTPAEPISLSSKHTSITIDNLIPESREIRVTLVK